MKSKPSSSLAAIFYGFLIATIAICSTTNAVCPNATDIKPCTCDDEGLQCLKLNNSGLARVFSAPAERKAIRRVWIFQTNLTALTKKAFGDYIIRDLYLDLNQIDHVYPDAFGEATKTLQSLSLTRNSLKTFPFEDLISMKKLKQLGLGHNRLTKIESRAFPPSETLESVDLSHNSISTIEPNAFAELYGVNLLDLSKNSLTSIESKSLLVKSSSRHLSISLRGNQIRKIAADAFGDYHPQIIDLSKNQLTYLDELTFAPLLTNSTALLVGETNYSHSPPSKENPFSCNDCDTYKWLLLLDQEYSENLVNFVCTDDTKLEDLTLEMIGCPVSDD